MNFDEIQEQVLLVLRTLDASAVVDIALLAAALLVGYRTFRPSGGLKIFVAIAAGTALFGLARFFQFRALNWVFENLRDVILILLAVVFQPEIRRIFERVVSLRRGRFFQEGPEFARQFARTVFQLASRKTGALFVFPGKESLSTLATGGFVARAEYSDALIRSIFDHHSPGHDGAVLLEGNRVQAFGLRLPLSETGTLPEDQGTRHHAAMGLAERSDAMIIAVSEERGTVTHFRNNRHRVVRNPAELESLVRSFYFKDARRPRYQRWARLAPQVLACLMVAFFFWAAIVLSEGRIRTRDVVLPAEFVGRPGGLVLADATRETVRLQLSGTREKLDHLREETLKLRFSLQGLRPGRHSFAVERADLDLPRGVQMLSADPAVLQMTLIAITEKTARVEPTFTGRLPEQFELLVADIDPDLIPVYFTRDTPGAARPVIGTVPINISGIRGETVIRARLRPPPDLRPVAGDWPTVNVQLEVLEKRRPGPPPREEPPESEPEPVPPPVEEPEEPGEPRVN